MGRRIRPDEYATVDRLWNEGRAPNGIAKELGGDATAADVKAYLRTVDLDRATRPEGVPAPS